MIISLSHNLYFFMSEFTFTDANFEAEVVKAKGLILVDFWAPWCGPCQAMGPIIEELAKDYGQPAD